MVEKAKPAKRTKKKETETLDTTKMIKDAARRGKLIIGTNSIIKGIKRGALECAIYANNCPAGLVADLTHYARIAGIELRPFNGNSVALGELCGKLFSVLIAGIATS